MSHYLAFDLGASSGRAILGSVENGRIELREVHRFENGPVDVAGGLYWNLLGLFAELKTGLAKALAEGVSLAGMAVDTWGVDVALLDSQGKFAGFPRHYRDPRTADILPWAFARLPRERLYERTGIQFLTFNTAFQLAAMVRDQDPVLSSARTLLFMPNALTYLLCGTISAEYTIASTSQLLDPRTGGWAWDVVDALGLPRHLLPPIAPPCTLAGPLRPALCAELNCEPIPVILVGSHDTASAVAAVPAEPGSSWAYLSSGTWSLLGVELDAPVITPASLAADYTNEGGLGGTTRFLKNIMGLWLIQECRRDWQRRGQAVSFDEMMHLAEAAEPFRSLIDPNAAVFVAPGAMPERIAAFCRDSGQPVPETPGQILRCAMESLALRYGLAVQELEQLTGRRLERLHLVGGGSRDDLLNQFTANAIGRPVVAGPAEATALGNIAGQALATGELASLAAAREAIRQSIRTRTYTPHATPAWKAAAETYRRLFC
ncbi:MAG: rhamnulokinase [Lentisphaerae bacterium]|nr:rhamnulokinase [Lentisphaerota bacterium]